MSEEVLGPSRGGTGAGCGGAGLLQILLGAGCSAKRTGGGGPMGGAGVEG